MIRLMDVLRFLRSCNTENVWRIEGAARLFEAQEDSRLTLPTFYVGLGSRTYEPLADIRAGFRMMYHTQIVIIWGCLTTFDDRTGKYAQNLVEDARSFLFRNLVNNRLISYNKDGVTAQNTGAFPTVPLSDDMMTMDRARYYHKFVFDIQGELQLEEVWQADFGPFNSIDIKYNLEESNPIMHPNAEDFITVTP